MRDGVRLATDVYLADGGSGDAPGPVILIRLPYDKSGEYTAMPATAARMNARGYHVVVQDVRGKFRSEGETVMFLHEARDGSDTIDWVIAQPWSNGVVGMWGDSYYGFTQFAAASTGHPALRAISPRLTGTRLGALPERAAGARTTEVEMGVHRLYPTTYFQSNDIYQWEIDWSRRPLAAAVEAWFATIGHRSLTYDAWLSDPSAIERFPLGHPFDAPAIPTLMTIGYWDNCAPWQWADHERIAANPAWAPLEYLRLEAIDHENYEFADVPIGPHNDHATNSAAHATMLQRSIDPALEFFDVFLRGVGTPDDLPRVRYAIAGLDGMHDAQVWPPPGAQPRETYLTTDSRLVDHPPGIDGDLTWTHDPDHPVPSPVDNAFAFLAEFPDERWLADRDDVLTFTAEPVDAPVVLAGPVELGVTIASSGPEIDLFARLCDVAPDGAAHRIAGGQLTLHDATEPAHVTVALGHVGYRLPAGHRLRLTIASSDAPEFVVAPGTGEHRWLATDRVRNEQRITVGGSSPAVLTVHVLPGTS